MLLLDSPSLVFIASHIVTILCELKFIPILSCTFYRLWLLNTYSAIQTTISIYVTSMTVSTIQFVRILKPFRRSSTKNRLGMCLHRNQSMHRYIPQTIVPIMPATVV